MSTVKKASQKKTLCANKHYSSWGGNIFAQFGTKLQNISSKTLKKSDLFFVI